MTDSELLKLVYLWWASRSEGFRARSNKKLFRNIASQLYSRGEITMKQCDKTETKR